MTARQTASRIVAFLLLALPVSIAATNAALVALALLLLACQSRFDWSRIRHPLVYALSAYCLVSLATALAGTDPGNSLPATAKDVHKLWVVSLLLLILDEPPREAPAWHGAGLALVCLVGLWQMMTLGSGDYWYRPRGFVHPVTYGEVLALGLLGALCFLRFSNPGKARRWALGLAALFATVLVLNQTRAAVLGVMVGIGALAARDKNLRRIALWALPVVVAVAIIWELMPTGRSLREFIPGAGTPSSAHLDRLELWQAALGMFLDYPLTGVGPANYRGNFELYDTGRLVEQVWGTAHNLYLHQLAERGILGALALAGVLGTIVVRAWRGARRQPGPWTYWACAASAAFLVMNFFEVAFQNEQVTTLMLAISVTAEAAVRAAAARA